MYESGSTGAESTGFFFFFIKKELTHVIMEADKPQDNRVNQPGRDPGDLMFQFEFKGRKS